jgi:hypothetical protein
MLREDEMTDQDSYKHKIKAEMYEARADKYRYEAYSTRSKANDLSAKAAELKGKAYLLESKADDDQDPVWKKIYKFKSDAFLMETQVNELNVSVYEEKRLFYVYKVKAAKEFAEFTRLKAKSYTTKIKINAPGECSPKKKTN